MRTLGGDGAETSQLFEVLVATGLVVEHDGTVRRTSAGDRSAKAMKSADRRVLGSALIRAGILHDQARSLIESGAVGSDGAFRCEPKTARQSAPQLVGLLQWWPEVQERPMLLVPKSLLDELDNFLALLPPDSQVPTWAVERKKVGDRAELYTVRHERQAAADPSRIAWVAQETDSLGWDVENRECVPLRRIEVKGSRQQEPVFYLSDKEWQKAQEFPSSYEVHFWGGIDLSRDPSEEFLKLRSLGFPLVLSPLVDHVSSGVWLKEAVQWRISRAAPNRGAGPT